MIGRFLRCKAVGASFWDFIRFILVKVVVESHMSCKEHSGFPKVTTVQVMNWLGELFPPYPRKVGRRCVSPFSPDVIFRPFSYCHVPCYLGNRQLEQGRILKVKVSSFLRAERKVHRVGLVVPTSDWNPLCQPSTMLFDRGKLARTVSYWFQRNFSKTGALVLLPIQVYSK